MLYRFRSHADGTRPIAGLVDVDGTLYGTTSQGGSSGHGTVFSVGTSGKEKVLYSFAGGSDGAYPVAGLIDVNRTLYGATDSGGSFDKGTFYSISMTGTEKVLHTFGRGPDGANPDGDLTNVKETLYGTTTYGGSGCGSPGCGTVYRIGTTGSEKVLHSFKGGSDGAYWPQSKLLDVNGTLYGTTYLGGGSGCSYYHGCGTVFSVTTAGLEKLLYRFADGSNGAYPYGGLVKANGALYGTTFGGGGDFYLGIVYSISTGGAEKVLHRFDARRSGARAPLSPLTEVNGTLYGTTTQGGGGTIYSISMTGGMKVLPQFQRWLGWIVPRGPVDLHERDPLRHDLLRWSWQRYAPLLRHSVRVSAIARGRRSARRARCRKTKRIAIRYRTHDAGSISR